MADTKNVQNEQNQALTQAKDFWTRNSKLILGVGLALVVLVGGFFVYKNFFQKPKELKAKDEMYKAEEYYRLDSARLALNGDGQYSGFLKIIDKYSGTEAANMAHYYAGICFIKLKDNVSAIKHLKKFDGEGAKQIQQRAYKLLGDAYGDSGNGKEALDYYKKAAEAFPASPQSSAEALFAGAYLAHKVLNDQKEAIELYKEIKEKYPQAAPFSNDASKYLAQLGVYNVN
jgi:tetratricopeptide (TPR) repeat protein